MSIVLRGNIWSYRFMEGGRLYRGSTKQPKEKKRLAEAFERDLRVKIRGGGTVKKDKVATLAEAATLFLAEKEEAHLAGNLARNTVRHYRNAWDAWIQPTTLAKMKVNTISAADINAAKFPGGPFTRKNAQQALIAILKWCAEEGYMAAAPHVRSKRLQGRKVRITPEIEDALRRHMDRDVSDIFTAMLDALMRPAEVFSMRWADIDWPGERYFIAKSKTEAGRRYVPLSDRMLAMLRARQAMPHKHEEWVFPSRIHAVGHRTTIAKQFQQARDAAGIDRRVKLYCARHTGASELSEMGVDLLTLRTILGHEDISTTNKYLHGDTKAAKDAVNERNKRKLGIVRRQA